MAQHLIYDDDDGGAWKLEAHLVAPIDTSQPCASAAEVQIQSAISVRNFPYWDSFWDSIWESFLRSSTTFSQISAVPAS